jgi:hypothetical protein
MMLFLDDRRLPSDVWRARIEPIFQHDSDWIIVRSYEEFVSYIKEHGIASISVISFDHDLVQDHYREEETIDYSASAMEVPSGWHCLKWLIEHCETKKVGLPQILFHTQNKQGERNMRALLISNNKQ